jgi:hypothetical protein
MCSRCTSLNLSRKYLRWLELPAEAVTFCEFCWGLTKEVGYDAWKTLERRTKGGLGEFTTLAKELRNIQAENSKDI